MSFVYDRDGKLRPSRLDMRTEGQLLKMVARAGLQSPRLPRILPTVDRTSPD
jgi:hypothetical protein